MKHRSMYMFRSLFFAVIVILISSGAWAGTIFVDAANTSEIEDGTPANPFNTITEGLDAAVAGDVVSVAPGIYYGALSARYKVSLVSQQGPQVTIIDGLGTGYLISAYFLPWASDFTVDGFTIQNGYAGVYACSSFGDPNRPVVTIRNCVLRDMGLGVRASIMSMITVENTVMYNVGDAVNAIWSFSPVFKNVTIDNAGRGVWSYQNGVVMYNTSISNVGTAFSLYYYAGVYGSNNNVWNAGTLLEPNGTPSYLNITNTLSSDPLFVVPQQDYHLQAGSPLINAGIDVGLPYAGSAPDIGAYEFTDLTLRERVDNLATSFAEAPVEIYREPGEQRRHALYQKLSAVLDMISSLDKGGPDDKARALNGCLQKLENDILTKTDGNNGGSAANDWITDPAEKTEFYNHVMELITNVKKEIALRTASS